MITQAYSGGKMIGRGRGRAALKPRGSGGLDAGKRKFEDEARKDFSRLEDLDLNSDDLDVLVVDTEEDDLLLGSDDEAPSCPGEAQALVPRPKVQAHRSLVNEKTNNEPDMQVVGCQMKWLRTVGMNESGKLICTVSPSAVDNVSESGMSGKTESINADTIRGLTDLYRKRRADIVDKGGIVATPIHVVKELAKRHLETVHCEISGFESGYHRVELFSGSVRGVGEAMNKRLAAQMAAIDLLERVQLSGGAVRIPRFGFLPGWLTSNSVFADLAALCKAKQLPRPKITTEQRVVETVDEEGNVTLNENLAPFRAECWVGEDLVTIGESEHDGFARREAAKEMFTLLTSSEYEDMPYAIGKCCRSADELLGAGYALPAISDYKRKWLLRYRVAEGQLQIPDDETGFDSIKDIKELEKDVPNRESLLAIDFEYEYQQKKKLKITLDNKKAKLNRSTPTENSNSRCVSVENKQADIPDEDWC